MKFNPVEKERPREEYISEDGNFTLVVNHVNHDSDRKYSRYAIRVERVSVYPGFGVGETRRKAMENVRKSLKNAIAVFSERVSQLDTMISEEPQEVADEVD